MDKEDSLKSCLYFDQTKLLEPKKFFNLMDHSMELIYRAFKNLITSANLRLFRLVEKMLSVQKDYDFNPKI
jgi:hypothetical protein